MLKLAQAKARGEHVHRCGGYSFWCAVGEACPLPLCIFKITVINAECAASERARWARVACTARGACTG